MSKLQLNLNYSTFFFIETGTGLMLVVHWFRPRIETFLRSQTKVMSRLWVLNEEN